MNSINLYPFLQKKKALIVKITIRTAKNYKLCAFSIAKTAA